MQLLEHNILTYNDLKQYIDNNQDCCVVNPCGSGKSSIIASIISDYHDKRILVITKQKNAANYYYNICDSFSQHKVPVITYNKLYNMYLDNSLNILSTIDICIIDEAHYIGANKWSKAISQLKEISECIFIGVTATPQRFEDQGTEKTIVDLFDGNSVGNFTTKQLQKQGVFIEPEYIVSLATLDEEITKHIENINESNISDELKNKYIQKLNTVFDIWNNECKPELIIQNVLPNYMYKSSGNKILVFSQNTDSIKTDEDFIMKMLKNQFKNEKIKSYEYSYKTSEKELHEFLNDTDNYINVLFSVNKICETIHISDLNIMIFLRSSTSDRIITQQIGRINDINNKNKSLIIDMVDNLSNYGNLKPLQDKNSNNHNSVSRQSFKYNFSFIQRIVNIFNDIDKLTSNANKYTYDGINGTLNQLCYIFRKDLYDVNDLLEQGYDITDAMLKARNGTKLKSITTEVFNSHYTYDSKSKLNDETKMLVCRYAPMIEKIAHSKGCYDEDIISETTLYLCELAANYVDNDHKGYASTYFQTKILDYILKLLRDKQDRTQLYENINSTYIATNNIDDKIDKLTKDQMNEILYDIIDEHYNIDSKNLQVLKLKFGFIDNCETQQEIAKILNISSSRVGQILAKELSILRRLIYVRKLHYLKEYYD